MSILYSKEIVEMVVAREMFFSKPLSSIRLALLFGEALERLIRHLYTKWRDPRATGVTLTAHVVLHRLYSVIGLCER